MLSFELTAIDLILTVGVVVLIILYVRSTPNRLLEGLLAQKERPRQRAVTEEDPPPKRAQTVSVECPYLFGYLRIRGNNVPIPEACLSCPRKQQCLGDPQSLTYRTEGSNNSLAENNNDEENPQSKPGVPDATRGFF